MREYNDYLRANLGLAPQTGYQSSCNIQKKKMRDIMYLVSKLRIGD